MDDFLGTSLRYNFFWMIACLVLLFAGACEQKEGSHGFTRAERDVIEGLMRSQSSTESLLTKLDSLSKSGDRLGQIVAYRYLGRTLRESSRYQDALEAHSRGLRLALEAQDTLEVIRAYNNIGTNYRRLGLLEEAAANHFKALSCSEAYSDTGSSALKNKVLSLNGIGNIYLMLEDFDAADSILRAALKGEIQLKSDLGQAINYANIGNIKEQLEETDSAWFYYRLSMAKNQLAHSKLGISLCHVHFGRLYEKEQDYVSAECEYRIAYEMMSDAGDTWHWLETCISLARIYHVQGKDNLAMSHLAAAERMGKQIRSIKHLAALHQLYSAVYTTLGDDRRALASYARSTCYRDSLVNWNGLRNIQNARIDLEKQRYEASLSAIRNHQKMKLEADARIIRIVLSCLLLAVTVILLLIYVIKSKAKTQRALRKMEKVRSDFFTNITHEFRTPLTLIMAQGEKIKAAGEKEIRAAGELISKQCGNMLHLINQLLDISKIESAIGEPAWSTFDVVPFIRMTCEPFHEYASRKRLDFEFHSSLTALQMDAVPDYLKRILTNLLSNAIKYTQAPGMVRVAVQRSGKNLEVSVTDSGRGIPEEDIPYLFDVYYRGRNATDEAGTGVGLSLVKRLAEVMEGTLSVSSKLGKGSCFVFSMPVKIRERHIAKEEMLPADDSSGDENQESILVVEDHSDVAGFIGSLLSDRYRIRYARNGEEGLRKSLEFMPDLIITDIMMPVMDGLALCRNLRANDTTSHIPVIVVTAKVGDNEKVEGLQAGVDAYVYKPFNHAELRIRVEKLLTQRRLLRAKYSKAFSDQTYKMPVLLPRDQQFIDRFTNLVTAGFERGLPSTSVLADSLCMSESQMRRKMIAITGDTPVTYILKLKVSKAKRLLDSEADLPIGEIASRCGFDDISYFSNTFRRLCGQSPSQYRRRSVI